MVLPPAQCGLLTSRQVNTVRIYNLSPDLNHNECASIFNAAGIYMILDVNAPLVGGSLNRAKPWESYNPKYMQQIFGVIESFKAFPNVLGFFSGNEVINEDSAYLAPAYVRAVQRDMKDYIHKNADRSIPIGYSAADVRDILIDTANYFLCDLKNSTNSRSDFFGLNSYSWCGNSSYTESGYDVLTDRFSNAPAPVFFSEYGCNHVRPRYFTEVQAIYCTEMTQAFSGGLVYEYTQEQNDYGLVKLNDNGTATLLIDYTNLQTQYEMLDMDRIESSNDTQTSVKPSKCSHDLITDPRFLDSFDLPKRLDSIQDLIDNGLKNAKKGKLVDVSSTTIPQTVYDYDGNEVSVTLHALSSDQANAPGLHKSGSTSSSGGSGGSNNSNKNNAGTKKTGSQAMSLARLFAALATVML